MAPQTHHLDRRAHHLIETGDGSPDDLFSTRDLADWLGVSTQFLEIGRSKGFGPRHVVVSPRRIRYRRSDILAWLDERTRSCTSDAV